METYSVGKIMRIRLISWNNSCKSGHKSNFTNINIICRLGGSRNINITSCSRDIAADGYIIISDSLSGRGSQRWKVDLVRDPVVTLNSDGDRELLVDVTGVLLDTMEALMVSGIQNININD